MIFMCALLLVLHHGVGEQRDLAAALDGGRHLALVPRAVPRDAARDDLAPLGDEVLQLRRVLVVDLEALVRAVPAHLAAAEAAPTAALLAAHAPPVPPVAARSRPARLVVSPESVAVHVISWLRSRAATRAPLLDPRRRPRSGRGRSHDPRRTVPPRAACAPALPGHPAASRRAPPAASPDRRRPRASPTGTSARRRSCAG